MPPSIIGHTRARAPGGNRKGVPPHAPSHPSTLIPGIAKRLGVPERQGKAAQSWCAWAHRLAGDVAIACTRAGWAP